MTVTPDKDQPVQDPLIQPDYQTGVPEPVEPETEPKKGK